MNVMHVSRLFSVSPEGPRASVSGDLVHLRQGDLDGACGPYCLFAALITLGLLDRASVIDQMWLWKGSSREGRLRDALKQFGVLSSDGTFGWNLVELTSHYSRKGLLAEHLIVSSAQDLGRSSRLRKSKAVNKKQLLQDVCSAIDSSGLAIIGVDWAGNGGHWLLVIGYQEVRQAGCTHFTHLLCLDPGEVTPRTSLWNAVIEVQDSEGGAVNRGPLSSNHWGMDGADRKCQIKDAVILSFDT